VTRIFKFLDSFVIQRSKPWTVELSEQERNLGAKMSGVDFRGGENVHNFVGELAGNLGRECLEIFRGQYLGRECHHSTSYTIG